MFESEMQQSCTHLKINKEIIQCHPLKLCTMSVHLAIMSSHQSLDAEKSKGKIRSFSYLLFSHLVDTG